MQEAGADAILELAFTIADGLQYCRTGILIVGTVLHYQFCFVICRSIGIFIHIKESYLKLKEKNEFC